MYSIGQFANMSKVTTRMLRHYDKIGLLKPNHTEQNGYRFYCDEDMYKISAIKQLRRFEFSLEEIDILLSKNDEELTKSKMRQKIEQLQKSAASYNYLILEMENQVRAISGGESILNSFKNLDILVGQRSGFLALCQRERTNEEYIDDMIDQIYTEIASSSDMISQGAHMTIFHQPYDIYSPDETDIEVCVPVNIAHHHGKFFTREIEGGVFISTIFIGSYDLIGNGYVGIFNWAAQNNYEIIGPTMERYYKDKRDTNQQDQYITEICIPVQHKNADSVANNLHINLNP